MKKMTWFITLALVLLWIPNSTLTEAASSEDKKDKIKWKPYATAKSQNSRKRKYFIYFYMEDCPHCDKLNEKTFQDKEVYDYINTNYTPIRVDIQKDVKLASQFGIQGVPDLRFLTPEGKNIARWPGYIEAKQLDTLLEYISTDSYEKISFNEFIKLKRQKNK